MTKDVAAAELVGDGVCYPLMRRDMWASVLPFAWIWRHLNNNAAFQRQRMALRVARCAMHVPETTGINPRAATEAGAHVHH